MHADAVFLLPEASGREALEEKSAIYPAQRMTINRMCSKELLCIVVYRRNETTTTTIHISPPLYHVKSHFTSLKAVYKVTKVLIIIYKHCYFWQYMQ